jgi:hypothetical protein
MDEYDKSFNSYFNSFLNMELDTFTKNFGEIIFGEIKSKYLKEYRKALKSYISELK